jgi:hypothetical protein
MEAALGTQTEEQRRSRPKDPPLLLLLVCALKLHFRINPRQNAPAGIYEMASRGRVSGLGFRISAKPFEVCPFIS